MARKITIPERMKIFSSHILNFDMDGRNIILRRSTPKSTYIKVETDESFLSFIRTHRLKDYIDENGHITEEGVSFINYLFKEAL